jgi:hypothetical protein
MRSTPPNRNTGTTNIKAVLLAELKKLTTFLSMAFLMISAPSCSLRDARSDLTRTKTDEQYVQHVVRMPSASFRPDPAPHSPTNIITPTVLIIGHVQKPGYYVVPNDMVTAAAVQSAGGAASTADLTRITIIRHLLPIIVVNSESAKGDGHS